MITRIAILHGGPADRTQVVVERFQPTIYCAINETINLTRDSRCPPDIRVAQARYEQVMSPCNPGRDCRYARQTYGHAIPDQEVALYVYVGEEG